MDEKIEYVAMALFLAEQPEGEPFNHFRWQHTAANYRLLAKAAIEAIEAYSLPPADGKTP